MKSRILAAAIVLAFLAAGIVGHDPWKPDEAYTFGLVMHVLETGDWVVPTLAGEPFMEKPPLFFVAAAGTAKAFSGALPLHDGARLAAFLFMALGIAATARAAHRLMGPGCGRRAALLAAGTFGIVLHAHEMITDTALFAGFAFAAVGLTYVVERPWRAGAWLGTGVGMGFLSKGLVEPTMVGLACMLLPVAAAEWRTRRYAASLACAALFALPWLVAWPVALYARDPQLFHAWFWTNNFGRYFGFAHLGASTEPWFYARTLPWFCLPAGALAAWTVWRAWRGRDEAAIGRVLMPAALVIAMLVVLSTASTSRALYALPLLVPLSILGSASVERLPERLGAAAAMVVGLVAGTLVMLAWTLWIADVSGMPLERPAILLRWLPGGFHFGWHPVAVACAVLVTAGWIALWLSRRTDWLALWTSSIAAAWCVWMTLMLPWIDYAKSFRAPFEAMGQALPDEQCVQSAGLGEPQRAMLQYVLGLTTQRRELGPADCPFLVLQSDSRGRFPHVAGDWRLMWQGERPGELTERFQLWESARRDIASSRPAAKGVRSTVRFKRRAGVSPEVAPAPKEFAQASR